MPLFDIGVAGEVFGMPRPDLLPRPYEVRVCGIGDEPVRLQGAPLVMTVEAGLDVLCSADTVVVPALASFDATVPGELVDALGGVPARRPDRQRVHRRVRPGRGRAARRAPGHHALDARGGPGRAVPRRPRRPARALRGA